MGLFYNQKEITYEKTAASMATAKQHSNLISQKQESGLGLTKTPAKHLDSIGAQTLLWLVVTTAWNRLAHNRFGLRLVSEQKNVCTRWGK